MKNPITFSASLDKNAKIITIICLSIFLLLFLFNLFNSPENFIVRFWPLLLLILPFICYGLKPQKYKVDSDHIIIIQLFKKVRINRNTIVEIERLSKKDLKGTWRMMGIGGMFGYIGKFGSTRLGQMTWYATNMQNDILIHLNEKRKILITPDNPVAFLKLFR